MKLYFKENTMNAARERLLSGSSLRTITGISRGASLAVISKKTDVLIRLIDFNQIIASICSTFYKDRLVCHMSIDSTIAEARENEPLD